ncbi:MAG TPA: adenylosuccinate lyase [Aestuariivirgaceae bacterium]|nr:adenylosuccinate lyase [Aestuariivirgaceae bacterium]
MTKSLPPSHMIDSRVFRDLYGSADMRAVFADEAMVARWLEVEAALARAQARLGLIPQDAADAISRCAEGANLDLEALRRGVESTGHPLVPAIRALERLAGEAGRYVHWGATTQDIIDTGFVLQLKDALEIIERELERLIASLAGQARVYKDTPMAGRTHGQHAVPVTLGYKFAVVMAELCRHRERLAEMRPRVLVGQLAGAAGTLASLGEQAAPVRQAMLDDLRLGVPRIAWHTARDGIAETVGVLAMIAATCGKFANEVVNLQRTEIAELAEPAGTGAVGSSTMPQKRNPMAAQGVVALARLVRQMPALALDAMGHEHERDLSAWQMEWSFVPETFIMTSGAITQTCRIAEGLIVDADRMRRNLALTGGLINAEAVMFRLAGKTGREAAHELVAAAVKRAASGAESFAEVLAADPEIARHLTRAEIDAALAPEAWLGESVAAVERIVGGE